MNAYGRNSTLNSILPAKTNSVLKAANNFIKTNVGNVTSNLMGNTGSTLGSSLGSTGWFTISMYVIIVVLLVTSGLLLYFYRDDVKHGWDSAVDLLKSYYDTPYNSPSSHSGPSGPSVLSGPSGHSGHSQLTTQPDALSLHNPHTQSIVEKVLPGGKEVFNISSNTFSYYDAEPLCSALGAELATYDQVKEAWSKGADWCNYGWVKGQMAVYPTSADTYKKMQSGPEDGRGSCGQVGVNGGYFDNPEIKYGVTCYGKKPPQTSQSAADVSKNTPTSPSALAYEQKVNEFKAKADSIGILPFNNNTWSA